MNVTDLAREYLKPEEVEVVISHHPCSDGFAAAWIAFKFLGSKATFVKRTHGVPIDYSQLEGKKVLFVDCVPDKDKLPTDGKTVFLALDHHASASRELDKQPGCFFDLSRSGATLAWDYFYPTEPVPKFIKYVEQRDLRLNETEEGKKFCAAFYKSKMSFENYGSCLDEEVVQRYVKKGEKELVHIQHVLKRSEEESKQEKLGSYTVQVMKSSECVSDIGDHLVNKFPDVDFAAIWYKDVITGKNKVSLRGRLGGIDVGQVAQPYGGGGHPGSSSFLTEKSYEELFQ